MTNPDPLADISDEEMDALLAIPFERLNDLVHFAVMGNVPGTLTAHEQLVFDGMKAEIAANPGVAYHPSGD